MIYLYLSIIFLLFSVNAYERYDFASCVEDLGINLAMDFKESETLKL